MLTKWIRIIYRSEQRALSSHKYLIYFQCHPIRYLERKDEFAHGCETQMRFSAWVVALCPVMTSFSFRQCAAHRR